MPSPVISVIIPAYNYPAGLERALRSLSRQTFSGCFEVLVIDDGSSAPLRSVTEQFDDVLSIRYLPVPNGGPARARNTGARQAYGKWIAFTDHDCEPAADWLERLVAAFELSPEALLGGTRLTGLPDNHWSVAHDRLCVYASAWSSETMSAYFSTDNLAGPRDLFLQAGGFSESFEYAHEDREFCARWGALGFLMRRVPEAVITHSHPLSGLSFCRQHFRYGQNALQYHRVRNSGGPQWTSAMRLRFYAGLLRFPWKSLTPYSGLRVSAMLAMSQLCYAFGYYSAKWASRSLRKRSSQPRARTSTG